MDEKRVKEMESCGRMAVDALDRALGSTDFYGMKYLVDMDYSLIQLERAHEKITRAVQLARQLQESLLPDLYARNTDGCRKEPGAGKKKVRSSTE
jgi:hypothetical protein